MCADAASRVLVAVAAVVDQYVLRARRGHHSTGRAECSCWAPRVGAPRSWKAWKAAGKAQKGR